MNRVIGFIDEVLTLTIIILVVLSVIITAPFFWIFDRVKKLLDKIY